MCQMVIKHSALMDNKSHGYIPHTGALKSWGNCLVTGYFFFFIFCGKCSNLWASRDLPNNFKEIVKFFSEIAGFPQSCDGKEVI